MATKNISPYSGIPARQFWKKSVAESHVLLTKDLWIKKFDLKSSDLIASAGSCFAQHLSRRLTTSGYKFMDAEPAPSGLPSDLHAKYGYATFSARYGNIYTTRQLVELAEEALSLRNSIDYSWERDGKYFDPLRPSVEPEGLISHEEVSRHRKYHLQKVLEILKRCDVFIFTLGLTEAWICNKSGRTLPAAPGTIAGSYNANEYTFRNFTHSEIKEDLIRFMDIVHSIQNRDSCKFLLTVSPVPLTATATENHVLVASTYSKSVLRGVAGELYLQNPNVDYFPSFEIINSPWSRGMFFEANQRNISPAGVDAVMRIFFLQHEQLGPKNTKSHTEQPMQASSGALDDDVVCEDALLDGFSK